VLLLRHLTCWSFPCYCSNTAPAGASRRDLLCNMVDTRRTGARTNATDGEDGGSLSAGTGSPTLGYKPNPTVRYCSYAILLALLAYLVAALLKTICSSGGVTVWLVLLLLLVKSFLWINISRKLTKCSTNNAKVHPNIHHKKEEAK
jgi:hypothetical protein